MTITKFRRHSRIRIINWHCVRTVVVIHLNSFLFRRNCQPKEPLFENIMTSMPKSSPTNQPSFGSRENGAGNQLDQAATNKIGRQGQIKDVRSIIANFRQTHPEQIPRRGRRMKNVGQGMQYLSDNTTAHDNDALIADLLLKHSSDINSPPSSNDSSYSNSQMLTSKAGPSNQFASLTGHLIDS